MGGCGLRGRGRSGSLWFGCCESSHRLLVSSSVSFELGVAEVLTTESRATYFTTTEIKPETHTVPMVQLADNTIRTIDHSDLRIPGIVAKGALRSFPALSFADKNDTTTAGDLAKGLLAVAKIHALVCPSPFPFSSLPSPFHSPLLRTNELIEQRTNRSTTCSNHYGHYCTRSDHHKVV